MSIGPTQATSADPSVADRLDGKSARLSVDGQGKTPFGRDWSGLIQAGLYPALAIAGLFILWEVATVVLAIPKFLVPAPSEIASETIKRWALLWVHTQVTFWEVVIGFLASVLIGVPLAVLITYSRTFERIMYPLLVSAQTMPKVALAPVFIVWFGFGLTPKVVVAFLIAFFPIVISTVVGLKASPPEMLHLVRSMGASPWQSFWKIRFPNALPSIFGGLKVAITLAVVGAIVGEFVGADKGLGYLIQVANGTLDTKLLFAAIAVLSIMGIILFLVIDILERRLLRWHVSQRLEQLQVTM